MKFRFTLALEEYAEIDLGTDDLEAATSLIGSLIGNPWHNLPTARIEQRYYEVEVRRIEEADSELGSFEPHREG